MIIFSIFINMIFPYYDEYDLPTNDRPNRIYRIDIRIFVGPFVAVLHSRFYCWLFFLNIYIYFISCNFLLFFLINRLIWCKLPINHQRVSDSHTVTNVTRNINAIPFIGFINLNITKPYLSSFDSVVSSLPNKSFVFSMHAC